MGTLTVRNIPAETLARFRVHAAEHGRSMEAEARRLIEACSANFGGEPPCSFSEGVDQARAILREALGGELPGDLVDGLLADRRAAAPRGE